MYNFSTRYIGAVSQKVNVKKSKAEIYVNEEASTEKQKPAEASK
jgi:hypothetical protein